MEPWEEAETLKTGNVRVVVLRIEGGTLTAVDLAAKVNAAVSAIPAEYQGSGRAQIYSEAGYPGESDGGVLLVDYARPATPEELAAATERLRRHHKSNIQYAEKRLLEIDAIRDKTPA